MAMNFHKYFGSRKWHQNELLRFWNRKYVSMYLSSSSPFSRSRRFSRMSGVHNPMYTELSRFNDTLPFFVSQLTNSKIFKEVGSVTKPYREVLEYNMSRGRRLRAMTLIHTYRELTSNYSEFDDDIKKIYALAWSVEIANSWAIMYDDAIDDSEFRRGALSWYYKKNKNLSIIFEAEFLRESINILLDQYLGEDENYLLCSKILRETVVRMEIGLTEEADYENNGANAATASDSANSVEVDLNKYTPDVYHKIVFNKTGNITYYLPLSLSLLMAGKLDAKNKELVNDLAVHLGNLWQAQNDYLDLYGDPKRTGKLGTDIQCGVSTWCILKAIELSSPEQKEVLRMNYGQSDPARVQRVRELFDRLEMRKLYKEYVRESRKNITDRIERCSDETLQPVLKRVLEATFRDEE